MELKDLKTRDKIREIYLNEIGFEVGKQTTEDMKKVPPEKMKVLAAKLMQCELEAVENYSRQFMEFLNTGSGFRKPIEFVYVICGFRLTLRSLQKLPFDKDIKEKIKSLNDMAKAFIVADSTFTTHPEGDDDA